MKIFSLLILSAIVLAFLSGCSGLLPRTRMEVTSSWSKLDEAKQAFDSIRVGQTTINDLKRLGFNFGNSGNSRKLSRNDLSGRNKDGASYTDPAVLACIKAKESCKAFEVEAGIINKKNKGNFVLDVLNFKKREVESGWKFVGVVVVMNGVVTYKDHSYDQVNKTRTTINPLGPLQHAIPGLAVEGAKSLF